MLSVFTTALLLALSELDLAAPPPESPPAPKPESGPGQDNPPPGEAPEEPASATVGASVYTLYTLDTGSASQSLAMNRVRFFAKLTPASWLRATLELEALEVPSVKDAFVTARISPYLGVTAGRFKKPFSAIELTSTRQLPLIHRGIVDDKLVRELGLGGRDLGVMLHGEIASAAYFVGGFNGDPTANGEKDDGEESAAAKDGVARFEWRQSRMLGLGLSGSVHSQAQSFPGARPIWATGIDARMRAGPMRWRAEAIWAEQPLVGFSRRSAGAIVYGSLHFPIAAEVELQPLVKAEFLDDDVQRQADQAWAAAAGVNLLFNSWLRVMIQSEGVWAASASTAHSSRPLLLELAFDHALRLGAEGDHGP